MKYIKNIFRLDFDILVLDQPDATTTIGACTGKDTLLVDLSNGSDPPTLCGTISGHHSKIALFINKRFALNKVFQRNASKFAIFYV